MIRNIRKAVSVLCAVALLLSLCVISFTGTSSAKPVPYEDQVDVWQTVLDLNFNNQKGIIAKAFAEGWDYVADDAAHGNAVRMNIAGYNPSYVQLGIDTEQVEGGTAFMMEVGKKYRITFEYKYLAGAYTRNGKFSARISKGAALQPDGGGREPINEQTFSSASETGTTDGSKFTLTADTAWHEYSFDLTVPDGYGVNTALLIGTNDMHDGYVLFDNVKVEVSVGEDITKIDNEYYFDWKTGDTPIDTTAVSTSLGSGHSMFAGVNNTGVVPTTVATDEGLVYYSKTANAMTMNGATGWAHNAAVYDTDAVEGGLLKFKEKTVYVITIKYKTIDLGGNWRVYLGIAANMAKTGGAYSAFEKLELGTVDDEWQEKTVTIDTTDATWMVGNHLYLAQSGSAGKVGKVLVESVKVKEVREKSGVAIVNLTSDGKTETKFYPANSPVQLPVPENDRPDERGFSGWKYKDGDMIADYNSFTAERGSVELEAVWRNVSSMITLDDGKNVTTTKFAVDAKLPNPTRPDGNLFFEGWYEFDAATGTYGKQHTIVPDYDVTLYAKYNGTYLSFDNKSHSDDSSVAAAPQIVVDPDDSTNKVVKLVGNAKDNLNIMLPSIDVEGAKPFELKTNTTYYISFKAKGVPGSDGFTLSVYRGDKSKYDPSSTTRTALGVENGISAVAEDKKGTWVTITGTFTIGETHYLEREKWSYQNHLFLMYYLAEGAKGSLYIDDVVVAEVMDEAPEGASTVTFYNNITGTMNQYGYPGEVITVPEVPEQANAEFIGWFLDKKFTVPYEGGNFGTEDLKVYAKWKATPFKVDFESYEEGVASARFKLEKDGANTYVNWTRDNDPTSSSYTDNGTPYRIFLNNDGRHYTVEEGQTYTINFKYKLLSGSIVAQGVTNGRLNGWSNYKDSYDKLELTKINQDTWETASVKVVAAPKAGGEFLSLGLAGYGNILVDDIVVEASSGTMNLYGTKVIQFNTGCDVEVDPIAGETGETIDLPDSPYRKDYSFLGWYTDDQLTTPFTAKTYTEEPVITLYASWILGKFSEGFEEFPSSILAVAVSGGYKMYKSGSADFDKSNVQSGATSLYRDGTQSGVKSATLCRESTLKLVKGKQYVLTFYVKPTNVTDATGTISIIGMGNNTTINTPENTTVVKTLGELKAGEWQRVEKVFTAQSEYIGISTTSGNDMYLDNFSISLVGYVDGGKGGDSSVNPALIALMVILAAGSLVITGKKVFDK